MIVTKEKEIENLKKENVFSRFIDLQEPECYIYDKDNDNGFVGVKEL